MSKQADKLLQDILEDKEDGMPWEYAVQEVQAACGVQSNTAEQYIRRSDFAVKETGADGEDYVFAPKHAGETLVADEDEVLSAAVGDRTSQTFGELPVLQDIGHPEIPTEHKDGYIRRRMADDRDDPLYGKTDVQVVTSAMADDDFSTLLIGKHGVGKDKLILHICANTNRPTIRLVANDDPDFVDLLVGTYAPNEEGNFVHKKGLLTVAIENGYTFILDEFNALSGKVQTMLNKILEGSDQNQLVIPETNQVIEPHEEFNFVATMNPNEIGYGGREDLDAATSSRFIPITLPMLESTPERKVIAQQTELDEDGWELKTLLDPDSGVITGIRSLHDQDRISMWPSTRDVIQIGRMADRLGDLQAATRLVLMGRAGPTDEDKIEASLSDQNW